jgi:hypothetical protein
LKTVRPTWDVAEIYALLASNEKVRWRESWWKEPAPAKLRVALQAPELERAIDYYRQGFDTDQNHYYSGLNALALLTVQSHLAKQSPDTWNDSFARVEEAAFKLQQLEQEQAKWSGAVRSSIESAQRKDKNDRWAAISFADLALLTSDRSRWIADQFRRALAGASAQEIEALERQLDVYEQLDMFAATLAEVRAVLHGLKDKADSKPPIERVLLFTGHRVDAPGRAKLRFPPTQKAEATAKQMIMLSVLKEKEAAGEKRIVGYAGGASGGDILFHEICDEVGIETVLLLAAPRDAFVAKSVQDSGGNWVERFDRLLEARNKAGAVRLLGDKLELPPWIEKPGYDVWQRNNRWTIQSGITSGTGKTVLIALWDGEAGDGPGGTKDMIETIQKRGGRVERLDSKKLLA